MSILVSAVVQNWLAVVYMSALMRASARVVATLPSEAFYDLAAD